MLAASGKRAYFKSQICLREIDDLFRRETGNTQKLDWNEVKDRPQARTWLRIDVVITKHFLARVQQPLIDFNRTYDESRVRDLAEDFQKNLQGSWGIRSLRQWSRRRLSGIGGVSR